MALKIFDKIMARLGYSKAANFYDPLNSGSAPLQSLFGSATPENYANLMKTYTDEIWVYACVRLIASTVAGLPWKLVKYGKRSGAEQEKTEVSNPDVERLLEYPNTNDYNSTWASLIEKTNVHTDTTGNAYWFLDEMVDDRPQSLQILNPSRIQIVPSPDKQKLIGEYLYSRQNGTKQSIQPEQIVHFKYCKPDDDYYGLGSITPAAFSIDSIKEAQRANLNIFKNGAKLDAVLTASAPLGEAAYTRLRQQWHDRYGGSSKSHQTAILENGMDYKIISANLAELEYINGIKLSREDICAVFGVPPLLVGILDKATYSNYKESLKIFWVSTIIPKLIKQQAVITRLVQRFDPELYFEFDISNIEALKTDQNILADIATKYFVMGIPLNAIITALGLPFKPVEGGDIGYLPFSLQPIGTPRPVPTPPPADNGSPEEQSEEGDASDADEGKSKTKIKYTPAIKKALWKQFDQQNRVIEKRYMDIIGTFMLGIELEVINKLNQSKEMFCRNHQGADIIKLSIESVLFDLQNTVMRWQLKSRKVVTITMQMNGDRELRNLGLSMNFNLVNPHVQRIIENYSLEKAKEVIGTLREELRLSLGEGTLAGEGIPELTKRVSDVMVGYKGEQYKAERIARTEVIGVANLGALESYKQAEAEGLKVKKAWLPEYDDRVRETHAQAGRIYNEDNPIGLDENFKVGADEMTAPTQGHDAAENINCRCALIPVPIEEV